LHCLSGAYLSSQPNISIRVGSAAYRIRVNVVSPGSIDTRRDNPEWYGNGPPKADDIPLGRQGKIDEFAATYLFLVSDGGGFITGQTIHVNGGAGYY
jgi:3-oxoacyl-[acyl-carrier protein] reductase